MNTSEIYRRVLLEEFNCLCNSCKGYAWDRVNEIEQNGDNN